MVDMKILKGFVEDIEERAAGRIEPFTHGRALFHDSYPLVWDMNFARVEREPDSFRTLAAEVEAVQGRAGLAHRKMALPDEPWARTVCAEARHEGWISTPL